MIKCNFWVWKSKLQGTLQLICLLSGYTFSEIDAEEVAKGLYGTCVDRDWWFNYDLSGKNGVCHISMGLDEDDSDIVFLEIEAHNEFKERLEFIDAIQSALKIIELNLT